MTNGVLCHDNPAGRGVTRRRRGAILTGVLFIIVGVLCNEWTLARLLSPDGIIVSPGLRAIIWGFDLFTVVTGLLIVWLRDKFLRILLSAALFVLLFPLVMETGTRGYFFLKRKLVTHRRQFSAELGLEATPNITYTYKLRGYGDISYSSGRYGFRVFGDPRADKTKVFAIGDSFTQGSSVSDGGAYFDYLAEHNGNIEMFAYGCAGYGSLQEYMILDRYFDIIKPDVVLWQFCQNDVAENSFELASLDHASSNRMTTPFYRDGKIEQLYPHPSWLYRNLMQHSYFLRLLDIQLTLLLKSGRGGKQSDATRDAIEKAVETSSEIMGLVRKRVGDTPVVAFSTVLSDRFNDEVFVALSRDNDILYIAGVEGAIVKARRSGIVVDGSPRDLHWNSTGHALAGRIILDYLVENKLVEAQ